MPSRPAVRRLEKAARCSSPFTVLPRSLLRLPERRINYLGIRRIELYIGAAGVFIFEEHFFEGLAPVRRAENSALLICSIGMAENSYEESIRVARIDGQLRNLLAVAQAKMSPSFAGIRRLVDSVSRGEVRALQPFAAPHVDNIGIGRGDSNGPDRRCRLAIEDWLPGAAKIVSFPDAAIHSADIENVWLARDASDRTGASPAERADLAPAQLLKHSIGSLLGQSRREESAEDRE